MLFHMFAHADKHDMGSKALLQQLKPEDFTPVRETLRVLFDIGDEGDKEHSSFNSSPFS